MSESIKVVALASWFVSSGVTRLELPGGQWLEVRDELSVGEERAAMSRQISQVGADGSFKPNLEQVGMAETAAYIVDWSLVDARGKQVPYSPAALSNLRPEAFAVIDAAVDLHKKAMADARKKSDTGSTSS